MLESQLPPARQVSVSEKRRIDIRKRRKPAEFSRFVLYLDINTRLFRKSELDESPFPVFLAANARRDGSRTGSVPLAAIHWIRRPVRPQLGSGTNVSEFPRSDAAERFANPNAVRHSPVPGRNATGAPDLRPPRHRWRGARRPRRPCGRDRIQRSAIRELRLPRTGNRANPPPRPVAPACLERDFRASRMLVDRDACRPETCRAKGRRIMTAPRLANWNGRANCQFSFAKQKAFRIRRRRTIPTISGIGKLPLDRSASCDPGDNDDLARKMPYAPLARGGKSDSGAAKPHPAYWGGYRRKNPPHKADLKSAPMEPEPSRVSGPLCADARAERRRISRRHAGRTRTA